MRSLNSILVEGVVKPKTFVETEDGVTFSLSNEDLSPLLCLVQLDSVGRRMRDLTDGGARKASIRVRVVGKLMWDGESPWVIAEHIENLAWLKNKEESAK